MKKIFLFISLLSSFSAFSLEVEIYELTHYNYVGNQDLTRKLDIKKILTAKFAVRYSSMHKIDAPNFWRSNKSCSKIEGIFSGRIHGDRRGYFTYTTLPVEIQGDNIISIPLFEASFKKHVGDYSHFYKTKLKFKRAFEQCQVYMGGTIFLKLLTTEDKVIYATLRTFWTSQFNEKKFTYGGRFEPLYLDRSNTSGLADVEKESYWRYAYKLDYQEFLGKTVYENWKGPRR